MNLRGITGFFIVQRLKIRPESRPNPGPIRDLFNADPLTYLSFPPGDRFAELGGGTHQFERGIEAMALGEWAFGVLRRLQTESHLRAERGKIA